MPNPRQPLDVERQNISGGRLYDSTKREASPLDLEDDDISSSNDFEEEEDDMDY